LIYNKPAKYNCFPVPFPDVYIRAAVPRCLHSQWIDDCMRVKADHLGW